MSYYSDGGACWLDFVECWLRRAIRDRQPDIAAKYAIELAHWWRLLKFNDLVEPQEIADKTQANTRREDQSIFNLREANCICGWFAWSWKPCPAHPDLVKCPRCLGTGNIPSETCDYCVDCQDTCPVCAGKGRITITSPADDVDALRATDP